MNRYTLFALFALFSLAPATQSENFFDSKIDISYSANSSNKYNKLDIYVPKKKKDNMPTHVYVHGGAWTKGDKSRVSKQQVQTYTSKGIIFVSLNYTLGDYPANIDDLSRASVWLKRNIENYGGNPENMILSGHSAGAHLVALLAVSGVGLAGHSSTHSAPSRTIYKAVYSVDTASYDLREPSKGPLSRFVNRQKRKTFGRDPNVLAKASPLANVKDGEAYSEIFLYATEKRADAISHMDKFKNALSLNRHKVTARIIEGGLSHADMKDAIFEPSSLIYKDIANQLLSSDRR